MRTVEVPEGFRAILVSDQLVERFADWRPTVPCEIRARSVRGTPIEASDVVIDVESRYRADARVAIERASSA
jgi:hypothetical protein